MQIHNIVSHQLVKLVDATEGEKLINPKGAFDKTASIVEKFINTTDKAYSKKVKAIGSFELDLVSYPLQEMLRPYLLSPQKSESEFLEMTGKAMDHLVVTVRGVTKATGGAVIFMHYDDSFMILLLSPKTVFNIKDFVLEDLEAMDLDSLRYAAKINVTDYLKPAPASGEKEPYLSFVRGTAQSVSGYFVKFIGCDDYAPPAKSTDAMIEAVRDYMESLNYNDEKKRGIEHQILEYCTAQRKSNAPSHLETIASLVNPEDGSGLITHINANNIKCSDVFEADPATLRKLKRYDYRSKKWNLSFDHELYTNKTIIYNKDDKTIIIKDVPDDFEKTLDIKQNAGNNIAINSGGN